MAPRVWDGEIEDETEEVVFCVDCQIEAEIPVSWCSDGIDHWGVAECPECDMRIYIEPEEQE